MRRRRFSKFGDISKQNHNGHGHYNNHDDNHGGNGNNNHDNNHGGNGNNNYDNNHGGHGNHNHDNNHGGNGNHNHDNNHGGHGNHNNHDNNHGGNGNHNNHDDNHGGNGNHNHDNNHGGHGNHNNHDDNHNKPGFANDYGNEPIVIDIEKATITNKAFRRILWTGEYMQLSLMSIKDEIGVEIHKDTDQFFEIEEGYGVVQFGKSKDKLDKAIPVEKGVVILVPAGTWHNVINKGKKPLKLYSLYAPPHHKKGTVEWEK